MKKYLLLIIIVVITISFLSNCDITNTDDSHTDMNDLVADPEFQFNTTNKVTVNLTSVDLQNIPIPNATFSIYKDDLSDSTLAGNFRKILTASTNENGVYEATISLPTYLDSIWIRSGTGFVRSFPVEVTGNGEAEVSGTFHFTDYKPGTSLGKMDILDDPFMTMWFVKHHDKELHYYYLAGDNQGEYNEGHIDIPGYTHNEMNVKSFTIADDGVMYFYDQNDKYLYKIPTNQIDHDPTSDVIPNKIGMMDGLHTGDAELNSLEFIDGVLYGFGKKNKTLYQIDITDASYSAAFTISFPPKPPGDPEITGLTCIGDDVYFVCKKGVNVTRPGNEGQLWRLDMDTHAITYINTGNIKDIECLAGHPNGYLYPGTHKEKWYITDPTDPNWVELCAPSPVIDIKDYDFYYQGEVPGPTDTDGDGVPDEDDAYPLDPDRAFQSFTPSDTEYSTILFEDLWPYTGDYDMNDLVLDYQICQVTNADDEIVEDIINFDLRASGAGYTLGFAIKFPDNYVLGDPDDPTFDLATVENNDNVVRFFSNQRTIFGVSGSQWINTTNEGMIVPAVQWIVTIPITETKGSQKTSDPWNFPPYNPFIFVNNTRSHEIHLADYPPTAEMNTALFGTGDDASNPATGFYFRTLNNLPWVINVTEATVYPLETYQITWAFLHFADWVNDVGYGYADWYSNTSPGYRDNNYIYFPPGK